MLIRGVSRKNNPEFSWNYIDRISVVMNDIGINYAEGRAIMYSIYHRCLSAHTERNIYNRPYYKHYNRNKKHVKWKKRYFIRCLMRLVKLRSKYRRKSSRSSNSNSNRSSSIRRNNNKYTLNLRSYIISKSRRITIGNIRRLILIYKSILNIMRIRKKKSLKPIQRALLNKYKLFNKAFRQYLYLRSCSSNRRARLRNKNMKKPKHNRIFLLQDISSGNIIERKINKRLLINYFMDSTACNSDMYMSYGNCILIINLKYVQLHLCVDYHGTEFTHRMLKTDINKYFYKVSGNIVRHG